MKIKIAAYEVREDEREIMERRAQERGIELVVSPEVWMRPMCRARRGRTV